VSTYVEEIKVPPQSYLKFPRSYPYPIAAIQGHAPKNHGITNKHGTTKKEIMLC